MMRVRSLMAEWLWQDPVDVGERLVRAVKAFPYTAASFFRWAWLRLTGKTAYRFAPMYETKLLDPHPYGRVSAIRQANGLYLPAPRRLEPDPTLRDDIRAAWDALEAQQK